MNVRNVFALITTDKLFECRDFYVKHLGFTVAFQATIYLQLSVPSEGGGSFGLALMPPDNPFGQGYRDVYDGSDVFNGRGLFLTIEVADAAVVYAKLKAEDAPIVAALKSEDWGQRHFMTRDPGGTIVDVVESIQPAPGYYDRFQVSG